MAIWRRKGVSVPESIEVTETVRAHAGPAQIVPPPRGFQDGIPLGGTTQYNPGSIGSASRREFADQLYGAYMACTWASACVDIIARTVTAAGLEITSDDGKGEGSPPPAVQQLQSLFDFVNPRENIRQLLRGIVTDLLVFGDAFIEVVWLGEFPVALYSLDSPSMIPIADEHGTVSSFIQQLDSQRTAYFDPRDVIHFTLDAPRGGVYGVGGIQKALLPITAWLFTAGLLKETMRKGDPPRVHLDYPIEAPRDDIERDRQMWQVKNLGVSNVGNPFITRGGASAADLKVNQISEYIVTLNQKRDEIISSMGVPPRKLSIAEPGQLGGTGEGATSDKTFRVNTCGPLAELILEKINYDLGTLAYGFSGWSVKFGEVDWRDDQVIEDIRDKRLRAGAWTLNRYRSEIGEEPVDGGEDAVLVDRQNLVLWSDLAQLSHSTANAANAGVAVPGLPLPKVLDDKAAAKLAKDAKTASEEMTLSPEQISEQRTTRSPLDEEAALTEAWNRDYQRRRKQALRELPAVDA